jgi:hypothetical protein
MCIYIHIYTWLCDIIAIHQSCNDVSWRWIFSHKRRCSSPSIFLQIISGCLSWISSNQFGGLITFFVDISIGYGAMKTKMEQKNGNIQTQFFGFHVGTWMFEESYPHCLSIDIPSYTLHDYLVAHRNRKWIIYKPSYFCGCWKSPFLMGKSAVNGNFQ